ncbi:MAG: 50S ribosomal protein L17 [Mycoplasmataceae bacterium RC_NB112A]|nr:MAG: 50S ribosomal protein L17 [Mycoplasmataceae bacterium RC_NB112A]
MSFISKFSKDAAWRRKVLKNLVADAILYESIETSLSLARNNKENDLTKLLAKLITWAKKAHQNPTNKQHFYKLALQYLVNKKGVEVEHNQEKVKVLDKLFNQLGKRYQERPGGYSRIKKLYCRKGDNSLRVRFSLVSQKL